MKWKGQSWISTGAVFSSYASLSFLFKIKSENITQWSKFFYSSDGKNKTHEKINIFTHRYFLDLQMLLGRNFFFFASIVEKFSAFFHLSFCAKIFSSSLKCHFLHFDSILQFKMKFFIFPWDFRSDWKKFSIENGQIFTLKSRFFFAHFYDFYLNLEVQTNFVELPRKFCIFYCHFKSNWGNFSPRILSNFHF